MLKKITAVIIFAVLFNQCFQVLGLRLHIERPRVPKTWATAQPNDSALINIRIDEDIIDIVFVVSVSNRKCLPHRMQRW